MFVRSSNNARTMNLAALTTKELAQRLDTIEDMGDGKPGEHRAIKLELERRDAELMARPEVREAFRTLHLVDLPPLN